MYSLEHVQALGAQPLKESSFPTSTLLEVISCLDLHHSIPSTTLRVLFGVFLPRLLLFWGVRWSGRVRVVTEDV